MSFRAKLINHLSRNIAICVVWSDKPKSFDEFLAMKNGGFTFPFYSYFTSLVATPVNTIPPVPSLQTQINDMFAVINEMNRYADESHPIVRNKLREEPVFFKRFADIAVYEIEKKLWQSHLCPNVPNFWAPFKNQQDISQAIPEFIHLADD